MQKQLPISPVDSNTSTPGSTMTRKLPPKPNTAKAVKAIDEALKKKQKPKEETDVCGCW